MPFERKSSLLLNALRCLHCKKQMKTISDIAFDFIDEDGSGGLDAGEIQKIMAHVANTMGVSAPTEDDLQTILEVLDDDGGGDVGKDEFLALILLVLEKMIEAEKEVQD